MLSIRLFIKALFSSKIIIITVLAIATFTASVILSLMNLAPVASGILSNFGISFFAASLIVAFDLTKGNKASCLMELFGIDPAKKITIVVPEFNKGKILFDPNDETKRIDLSEIPSMSKTDCLAASNFITLFLTHNIGLPEIITDEEALEMIEDDRRMEYYGNFISIGLNSNKFSKKIAENSHIKNVINFGNNNDKQAADKVISRFENNAWCEYTPHALSGSDLALLLKSTCETNHVTYSVVICGGLNATGTRCLGAFSLKKWYTAILPLKFDNLKINKHKNYSLIYKINGRQGTRLDKDAIIETDPIFKKGF